MHEIIHIRIRKYTLEHTQGMNAPRNTFRTRVCIPHVNVCVYVHERKLRGKEGGYGVIFIELMRLISLSIEEFDSIVINTRRTNHCARENCVIAVVDVHSSYALHIFLDMCSK